MCLKDITLLKAFLKVGALGFFVAAPDRLFVTQSAVLLRIKQLEVTLGKPLFTRTISTGAQCSL
jgi:DNA-binding transcriptional LysR family regulator